MSDIERLDQLITELRNEKFDPNTELDMTTTLAYELFGESIDINDQPSKETTREVLITKKERAGFDKEAKMKFLDRIKAEQQPLFQTVSVSIDSPDKLKNTHSLINLLSDNQSNFSL